MVTMTRLETDAEKLTPRQYQVEGINWLATKQRAGLTDEPGLGKTLQASEAARAHLPVLVVCPTYLTEQWYDFLCDQYPDDIVVLASGSSRSSRQKALNYGSKKGQSKPQWYIINTEMLRSDYTIPKVQTVIFDESHHLRHRDSKQSKAAAALAHSVKYVYLLTATPIVREPDDVYHQLHMIDPERFHSYWEFVNTHFYAYESSYGIQINGIRNRARFRDLLSEYFLGRTYGEVGVQLPDLINHTARVTMAPESRAAYDDLRFYYAHEDVTLNSAMQVMHALRTICGVEPKKRKYTIDLAAEFQSYVIFCYYKHTARKLGEALGVPVVTGDIPAADRPTIARTNPKLICTIDSMSEGVDLSHIRTVIFYEEYYTHGVMYQALSRVRRFTKSGNPDPVVCYYIHCKDSIDEVIHATQSRRSATAMDVVKKELAKAN